VIDQTGTLDAIQRKGPGRQARVLRADQGNADRVPAGAHHAAEDIASYANRVGQRLEDRPQGVGDGVLVVVAKDDRKVRIEVAKTLEGAIPDLAAKQDHRGGDHAEFRRATSPAACRRGRPLIARVNGERCRRRRSHADERSAATGFDWFDLAIFLFFAVPIAGRACAACSAASWARC
jgi:uncharacterized protein